MTGVAATPAPSLWRDVRFLTFWAGQSVSQVGDRISELALPLIAVVQLGASSTQVGVLTAAVWAPNLLSLLVGSSVERRRSKKRIMVVADLLRAAALTSLPVAYWLDALTLGQLVAVALLAGVGQVLFATSYAPFFVALVERRQYVDANSKLHTSIAASFVVGPAVGGSLIQWLTAPVAVLVDAATFVVSAVLVGRVRVPPTAPEPPGASVWSSARAGLAHVVRDPYLRASLGCVTTVNLFTFMAQAIVLLFATRTLGLTAGPIGLAFGIGAVGGVTGAVLAPRLSCRFGLGRMTVLGAVLFPAPLAAVAAAGGTPWQAAATLAASEFAATFGVMLLDVNLNSVQAVVVPDPLRSRVSGAFGTINYGIRPLGALAGGFLGSLIGLRPTLLVAAVGGTLCCLWLLPSPIPRLSGLEDLHVALASPGG